MPISLKQLIDNYKSLMLGSIPSAELGQVMRDTSERERSVWFKKVLRSGSQAPELTLDLGLAKPVLLADLLTQGSVLLKFYRGRWCPFCTLELKAYERLIPALRNEGVQLIAISGESPAQIELSRRHDGLNYEIASDADLKVAGRFNLNYRLSETEAMLYQRNGCDPANFAGSGPVMMALPALYLIEPNGQISFASVRADPSIRAEPVDVLAHIRQQKRAA